MFRKDLEKSQSISSAHYRSGILMAIEQMQSSLGLQDLGKLFHKPLRDSESTIVFCSIQRLLDPKAISCLSVRWLPLTKLHKRLLQQQQAQQQQLFLTQQLMLSREMFSERVSDSGISSLGNSDNSPKLIGDILLSSLDVSKQPQPPKFTLFSPHFSFYTKKNALQKSSLFSSYFLSH